MKKFVFLILTVLQGLVTASAQQKGYEIIGDSVVFTFRISDYDTYTHEGNGERIAPEDLNIDNVYLAGTFNDWSREGWKMSRISQDTFRLTKSLDDLKGRMEWEFKFVINSVFWAEPDRTFQNISLSEKSDFWRNIYNLNLHTVAPDPNGNATFFLTGHKDAVEVILAGSFNKWNEEQLKMKKTDKGWSITLNLPPGSYTYKYIVDGAWIHDPGNPQKNLNEYGGYNSVKVISTPVTFQLKGFEAAEHIFLAGTFNKWDPKALPMSREGDLWNVCIDLPGGKHQYKFIVDGNWILDPENELKEYDAHGHLNSVIMIK